MHVFTKSQADSPNRRAVDVDAKVSSRQSGVFSLQKIVRILYRVRMWERVA